MSVPSGYVRRAATIADVSRAAEVVRVFEEHATGAAETTLDDVADWWRELDPEKDVWLVDDAAGGTAAYGAVYRDGGSRMQSDGYVIPSARNRGIGRYLVGAMEARAAECGAAVLTNGVLASDPAAQSLLASSGYAPARRFARMVIEMASPPEPSTLPAGVDVRTFRPGADERAFHAVLNEAFAEHWGHAPETFERWREITIDSPRFDPSLWLVAEERGELIGIVRSTWKESDIGWVNDLGVLPGARRRGIALGLLTRAFGEFYARGERTVGLGVDTENETGATLLYERAGMHATYTAIIFEKRLAAGEGRG